MATSFAVVGVESIANHFASIAIFLSSAAEVKPLATLSIHGRAAPASVDSATTVKVHVVSVVSSHATVTLYATPAPGI